jgi:hypothetical protein
MSHKWMPKTTPITKRARLIADRALARWILATPHQPTEAQCRRYWASAFQGVLAANGRVYAGKLDSVTRTACLRWLKSAQSRVAAGSVSRLAAKTAGKSATRTRERGTRDS